MNWLELVLKYLPTVIQVVTAVQQNMKSETPAVRKDVALNLINVAQPIDPADTPSVAKLVDGAVQSLKSAQAAGFTKSKSVTETGK